MIDHLDCGAGIERYDSRPGTLFCCGPPYLGCTDDYGKDIYSKTDFERLRDLLVGLQRRFTLSLNDTPEVRDIFGRFAFEEVEYNYWVSGSATHAGKLIISGPQGAQLEENERALRGNGRI